MASIADLTRYEPEHSTLDFKRVQYTPDKHEALLVDLMALANAHVVGDRHIIVGVIPVPGGPNDVRGIDAATIVDDATYQKLVHDNIEPEIGFSYTAERVDNVVVGVFRLFGCSERPYVMRKDFGKLRRGFGYIRKGTHQTLLSRDDYDQIYAARLATTQPHAVRVVFDAPGDPVVLDVEPASAEPLPSEQAANQIRAILADRAKRTAEREAAKRANAALPGHLDLDSIVGDPINNPRALLRPFGGVPYEERSTDDLRRDLVEVRRTYEDEDAYTLGETRAAKVNLRIINGGRVGVHGAAIELRVVPPPWVSVADEPAREPTEYIQGIGSIPSLGIHGYPVCERDGPAFVFRAVVGDIRPGEAVRAFGADIRLTPHAQAAGSEIRLSYRLLGQNVDRPVEGALTIRVREQER